MNELVADDYNTRLKVNTSHLFGGEVELLKLKRRRDLMQQVRFPT